MKLTRRALNIALAGALVSRLAAALGRIPYGGQLSTALPWPLLGLDPHELNDPVAAFLGAALFEPLYAHDARNRLYPTLALDQPHPSGDKLSVNLREIYWSTGARISADEVVWSLQRSRRLGGKALLGQFSRFEVTGRTSFAVRGPSPQALMRALSSPLCALIPRAFHPLRPIGCGPFSGRFQAGRLILSRNGYAARGPAFLERMELRSARDLGDALRQFEAGECSVGWFGRGLHEPRPNSNLVDAGHAGWVVLHAGAQLDKWAKPGVVQSLLAAIDAGGLDRFGLRLPPSTAAPAAYGGPSCELLVRGDAPYLVELANSLAAHLSAPGRTVRVRSLDVGQLRDEKTQRRFGFLLDVVRPLGPTPDLHQLSLLSEAGLPYSPPHLPPNVALEHVPDIVTRSLSLGVVGSLRLLLGVTPEINGLQEGSLADAWLTPSHGQQASQP